MRMIKKYAGESSLIVFSVLFALLINKLYDDYLERQRANDALSRIKQEIWRNQGVLETWKEAHQEMLKNIVELNQSEDLQRKRILTESGFLDFSAISGQDYLINSTLIDASWQTALGIGALKEVDYEKLETIIRVYELQELINDKTIQSIVSFYFRVETHSPENIDDTLMQLQLRFRELTGQEQVLGGLYAQALEVL